MRPCKERRIKENGAEDSAPFILSCIQKGDVKYKCRECLDGTCRTGSVSKIVWNHDLPTGADRHFSHRSDPSCNEFIEAECGRTTFLGLVENLSVDEFTYIIYGHETLWRWFRAVSFCDLTVHHAVEHYLHARSLGIFLQELLVPEFVSIIYWWHITVFLSCRACRDI